MAGLVKTFAGKTRFATSDSNKDSSKKEKRFLLVTLVGARNIKAVNKTSSEPYAVLSLRDLAGREIKNESFTTKRLDKPTLDPIWNEEFKFGKY